MKNIFKIAIVALSAASLMTSCMKEINPQSSYATSDQVAAAPGAFDMYVSAITASMVGSYSFGSSYAPDLGGYPSFMLHWGVMGQDLVIEDGSTFFQWYSSGQALGNQYLYCQMPWTYFYKWINNCNIVLGIIGGEPNDSQKLGAGTAYACRAFCYMDMARMFAQETYALNKESVTVPLVTEKTQDLANNPRATNEVMWAQILSDLDNAEKYLEGYDRGTDTDKFDVSVVYALKARAYLTMENYPEAEKYAKLAQEGYSPLTEAQYMDRNAAFNTPNNAWIHSFTYEASDAAIKENDSDTNWGCQWFLEGQHGCWYASSYGQPKRIDAHLYSTIPDTDFRKMCFIDPAVDDMSKAEAVNFLANYTDYPEVVVDTPTESDYLGYIVMKFRAAGGDAGRKDNFMGTVVSVPSIRVEEMILIEAEAIGMQEGREAEGIAKLTAFAKTRDAAY
ncbi:MAG: RagB/SusD family nutrient uptake outer membrane protein, partial [Alistipes sp.]|nr:RagB/SusD family nutrient uptake outer membrane protein [Alistipes sp.]